MGQPSQLCSELCFLPPRAAGFAVVKKGKDKKTGAPVAIKVSSSVLPCPVSSDDDDSPFLSMWFYQVVDKSRYAAGDNSLEREIQVLIKVSGKAPPAMGR